MEHFAELIHYKEKTAQVTLYVDKEFVDIFTSNSFDDNMQMALNKLRDNFNEVKYYNTYCNTRGWDIDEYIVKK